ncbi:MAG: septum formation initiator family protein [Gemmatimonadetes bacterium]|nr:septum formation initiator family protein [Gemmatimonadota bacterium]MYB59858.1 septum formation initiator family protein [Gemmatimonadota bacterium]
MTDKGPFKSDASRASDASAESDASRAFAAGRRRPRKRTRLRWIVLGVIAVVFGYVYIGGSYGWYNMWKLREQRSRLQADLKELESRERVLTGELELLEGDAETDDQTRFELERRAREEHGMVREDELIYRFPAETFSAEVDSAETDSTEARTSDPDR